MPLAGVAAPYDTEPDPKLSIFLGKEMVEPKITNDNSFWQPEL